MRTNLSILASLILLAPMVSVAQTPAPDEPLTVAVLDFQVSGREFENKGAEAAVLVNAKLSAEPNLIMVERQELEKILGEQELGQSGTVTPETAAKIGFLTGAKVLVTGRIFGAGDKYFAVAKIISTETSRVYGETAAFTNPSAIDTAAGELATKISALIGKRGDTLVAKVEPPEARFTRLKQLVEGKTLPSVAVTIAEKHIDRTVIDPAAQTEMKLMLQQLGFEVIDPNNSNRQPGVLITGEAFSEFGGRRGNFVSCRARVEIKVTDPASGKLLLADRQNDVAVDLAENVAGKRALENAALKLLDRAVPKLVER